MSILFTFIALNGFRVDVHIPTTNLHSTSDEGVKLLAVCRDDHIPQFLQVLKHYSISSVSAFLKRIFELNIKLFSRIMVFSGFQKIGSSRHQHFSKPE